MYQCTGRGIPAEVGPERLQHTYSNSEPRRTAAAAIPMKWDQLPSHGQALWSGLYLQRALADWSGPHLGYFLPDLAHDSGVVTHASLLSVGYRLLGSGFAH